MFRIAAALIVWALTVSACTSGGAGPPPPSESQPGTISSSPGGAANGTGVGGSLSAVKVVVVYRPVCGPEPRSSGGATSSVAGCAEEPVVNVEVVATGPGGSVAARGTTTAGGSVVLDLSPGRYVLTAAAAAPPRITPAPVTVTVGTEPVPTVTLVYESSMQ